jgi:hypothetical protein
MIDYNKYPPNWKTEIRPRILRRAVDRCEICGVKNGSTIRRHKSNPAHYIDWDSPIIGRLSVFQKMSLSAKYDKPIKVVLTVAHLDHDPENWEVSDDRLKAMCQRCHLLFDKGALS